MDITMFHAKDEQISECDFRWQEAEKQAFNGQGFADKCFIISCDFFLFVNVVLDQFGRNFLGCVDLFMNPGPETSNK